MLQSIQLDARVQFRPVELGRTEPLTIIDLGDSSFLKDRIVPERTKVLHIIDKQPKPKRIDAFNFTVKNGGSSQT